MPLCKRTTNENAARCAADGVAHRRCMRQPNEYPKQFNSTLQAADGNDTSITTTEASTSPDERAERGLSYGGARPSLPVLLNRYAHHPRGGCCAEAHRRADELVGVRLRLEHELACRTTKSTIWTTSARICSVRPIVSTTSCSVCSGASTKTTKLAFSLTLKRTSTVQALLRKLRELENGGAMGEKGDPGLFGQLFR